MVLKVIYYVAAYIVGNPVLSCCLTTPISFLGTIGPTYFTFGYYQLTMSVLLEAFPLHFLIYAVGFTIVYPFLTG